MFLSEVTTMKIFCSSIVKRNNYCIIADRTAGFLTGPEIELRQAVPCMVPVTTEDFCTKLCVQSHYRDDILVLHIVVRHEVYIE